MVSTLSHNLMLTTDIPASDFMSATIRTVDDRLVGGLVKDMKENRSIIMSLLRRTASLECVETEDLGAYHNSSPRAQTLIW